MSYSFGAPNNMELVYDFLKQLEQLPLETEAILYIPIKDFNLLILNT